MTVRGIVLGLGALGGAWFLERQLGTLLKDVRRYDRLRAMSGDSPLLVEGVKQLGGSVFAKRGSTGTRRDPAFTAEQPRRSAQDDGQSLFETLRSDAQRYLTMRAM